MKNTLLAILLSVTFLYSHSQSNIYHKFPTSDATWRERSFSCKFHSDCDCSQYQNVLDGDTLVGSNLYHKIRQYGLYYDYAWCGAPLSVYTPSYFEHYIGAYREDTLNKKVYFLPPASSTDTLLYNFNISLGDTVPPSYLNRLPNPIINVVTAVDSVLILSEYHKRFELSAPNWSGYYGPYVHLIEGIGSTFGLLGKLRPPPEAPVGSTLNCFWQNGSIVYPDPLHQHECDLIASGNDVNSHTLHNLLLYPNPLNQSAELIFDRDYNVINIEVYNSQASMVLQQEFLNSNRIHFDRNKLANGLYLFKITLDGTAIKTEKVIVQD